ncbi:MAG: hypothetical protein FJ125_11265, partial [Deltaproteobacteria bacterium]|nr:hypothetical protein [Deltaproteobacteria bacterium]
MVICYRWLEGGSGFIRLLPAGPDGQPVLPAGRLWLRVERVCLGEGNGQEAGTQVAAGLVLDGSLGHAQAAPSDADQLTVPLRGCELPVELAP